MRREKGRGREGEGDGGWWKGGELSDKRRRGKTTLTTKKSQCDEVRLEDVCNLKVVHIWGSRLQGAGQEKGEDCWAI